MVKAIPPKELLLIVSIYVAGTETKVAEARTTLGDTFEIADVPPGNYEVAVFDPVNGCGYGVWRRKLKLRAGQVQHLKITMRYHPAVCD
ncbi:MAG TPA: hypothetical protein VEJ38_07575 [Candidatus Acidoferrales bacterium]|nr:hypothetical protein [Candidatus Acidoferrales bacterium]